MRAPAFSSSAGCLLTTGVNIGVSSLRWLGVCECEFSVIFPPFFLSICVVSVVWRLDAPFGQCSEALVGSGQCRCAMREALGRGTGVGITLQGSDPLRTNPTSRSWPSVHIYLSINDLDTNPARLPDIRPVRPQGPILRTCGVVQCPSVEGRARISSPLRDCDRCCGLAPGRASPGPTDGAAALAPPLPCGVGVHEPARGAYQNWHGRPRRQHGSAGR